MDFVVVFGGSILMSVGSIELKEILSQFYSFTNSKINAASMSLMQRADHFIPNDYLPMDYESHMLTRIQRKKLRSGANDEDSWSTQNYNELFVQKDFDCFF